MRPLGDNVRQLPAARHVDAGLTYDLDDNLEGHAMSKPIDYDSPRRPEFDNGEDSAEELTVRRTAARSQGRDIDEAEAAGALDLSGADESSEELSAPVVPMQSDEFRCTRCFLVHHQSRLAARPDGQDVCRDCF